MKKLVILAVVLGAAHLALGDIQDPPGNDYGPTRKLGRGLANFYFAPAEIFDSVTHVNKDEGNTAAATYGLWRGVGRTYERWGVGFFEVLTFPFPNHHDTYLPILPSDIPWIHTGYAEFPPELGNESKYNYVRDY